MLQGTNRMIHKDCLQNRIVFFMGSLLTVSLSTSVFGIDTDVLTISPESSTKIDVPNGVRKIYISNPNVIDASPDDDGYAVLVTGIKQGKAELRISRLNLNDLIYKVEVEPELKELALEVAKMLEDVEGLNVKIVGDRIVLDGDLITKSSVERAKEVAVAFEGRVTNLTKLDPIYTRNVKRALEKEIGIDTVEIKVDGDRLVLMGTVPSIEELKRVKEIAEKRADNTVILLQVRR